MNRLVLTVVLALAVLVPAVAHADEPFASVSTSTSTSAKAAADEPRWLVSLPLLGLERSGLVLQGEYYLSRRLALTLSAGGRWPDAGDYSARALVFGAGVRWFFLPHGHGGGAFLAGRVDATRRWLVDDSTDRGLGRISALAGSLLTGWRFVAWRHLEITPEVGLVQVREWTSAPLAARSQTGLAVGLTLGWLF